MNYHTIHAFLAGPMVVVAVLVFGLGSLFRILRAVARARATDPQVLHYFSLKFGLRSILKWLTPFAPKSMQKNPLMTVATFIFHIGVLILPFFVLGHTVLFYHATGITLPSLPDVVSDTFTLLVILALLFLAVRRMVVPEVRFLTRTEDALMLIIAALPFITGLWAFRQYVGADIALLLHMATGELMLMAIPFTRLSHMFHFFLTRAYIGSEFGAVRNARDW